MFEKGTHAINKKLEKKEREATTMKMPDETDTDESTIEEKREKMKAKVEVGGGEKKDEEEALLKQVPIVLCL